LSQSSTRRRARQISETTWFNNAVIYGVNLSTFQDGDGDGIGDLTGLISRLDYLADLGVDCLWLLPFYPSPRRDNGYDVSNYYDIDPRYGTLDDFRDLVTEANDRGIRIIIDLVVHHTSDKHPWFQAACADRGSQYRDYYIWSDTLPKVQTEESFFPEVESGVWRFEPISKSYYHHGFYHFQPDLNFANERVQDEVLRIVDFWLSFGVAGFRLDAANNIIGQKGLPKTELVDPGEFWQRIRKFIDIRQPDAVMLAEADMDMHDIDDYVYGGRGIHMLLNFWTNQTMMYALATSDARPLNKTLANLPQLPAGSQYVNFLRNLDEFNVRLKVPQISWAQQKELFKAFGPRKDMQVYGRGIRRRLAPMLGNQPERIKLAFSLLFSMPGAPMFVYGDEIGMGENLKLPERDSVRTPMQWDEAENGGFSLATGSDIIARTIMDARYDYKHINVKSQLQDADSLLSFVKHLIHIRQENRLIGHEPFTVLGHKHAGVFALKYSGDTTLIAIHNLTPDETTVALDEPGVLEGISEVLADSENYEPLDGDTVKLNAYGFRWFKHD
jgi:maltose alpha-D-glucosyltransferase/alpha-amylase